MNAWVSVATQISVAQIIGKDDDEVEFSLLFSLRKERRSSKLVLISLKIANRSCLSITIYMAWFCS